jgi:hypothetical protein
MFGYKSGVRVSANVIRKGAGIFIFLIYTNYKKYTSKMGCFVAVIVIIG